MIPDPIIPMLDLKAQYTSIRAEVDGAIARVMESQHFILGAEVQAFEREIADYCGCGYGIGVSSGTDALLLALMALDIRPGDEVITSPYTFFATAGSIARLGARPVFVDVEPGTLNLDANLIEAKITARTRAILPVHLAGQVADMDAMLEIAGRHGLPVVEDACQALGAEYRGRRAGSFGRLGCFSFYPSKNLGGAGDSGMLVCNDPALAGRVALLRNHGQRAKDDFQVVGGNFRMDALQAAILRAKLPHLEEWTAARRAHADTYRRLFAEAGLGSSVPAGDSPIILPGESDQGRHIYHLFQVRARQREALMEHLKTRGISSDIYYRLPLHLQECFIGLGYLPGDCPNAEQLARETLALPIYPEMTEAMIERVVGAVEEFYKG